MLKNKPKYNILMNPQGQWWLTVLDVSFNSHLTLIIVPDEIDPSDETAINDFMKAYNLIHT